MGVVYRATHLALDRTVALKVIAPALTEDASARQRFLRESKIAASIDHPNVIPIYYAGEEDGIAYIAMRYVSGEDLRSRVRAGGPLDPEPAAGILAQVGAALDAAHAAGLVHRDVKPANVLLGPADHVYLSDFGLSKHALSVGGETRSGHWVGTLDYVAPEQIRGERLDARADVYALGCVLYFALTGHPPFERDGDEARLWGHLSEPPPAPSDRVQGLPTGLDVVVARALAKRPADRYPSAGDLGRAAVAAAGHGTVRERERVVGVGAAAPDETPTETASARDRALRPSEAPTQVERPARALPPRVGFAAGFAALAAAVVVVVMLAKGGDGRDSGGSDSSKSGTQTPVPTPAVVATVEVGRRPNGIAVGDGTVFVTDRRNTRVTLIDEKRAKRRGPRPTVGAGGVDVATGSGAVWVVVNKEHALFKLDPTSGRQLARVALPMAPQTVAVGPTAVWVGMFRDTREVPDVLARINPRTDRVTGTFPMAEGITSLAATPTAVWVVHRSAPAVSRFDLTTRKLTRRVPFGNSRLGDAAYAAGAVWVTSPLEDTVSRIDDKTSRKVSTGVGRRPTGIAARGEEVWVTSYIDHTITRLDPKTGRRVGRPVDVPLNPYVLTVTRDSVWLAAVGSGVVAQVRYTAAR
jgi:hypothetical protein